MKPYKFVNTARQSPLEDKDHNLLIGINSREDIDNLSEEDRDSLCRILLYCGNGIYKCAGWAYDLTPYLRKFYVKHSYEPQFGDETTEIVEFYAIDQEDLRSRVGSSVIEVVELTRFPDRYKIKVEFNSEEECSEFKHYMKYKGYQSVSDTTISILTDPKVDFVDTLNILYKKYGIKETKLIYCK